MQRIIIYVKLNPESQRKWNLKPEAWKLGTRTLPSVHLLLLQSARCQEDGNHVQKGGHEDSSQG